MFKNLFVSLFVLTALFSCKSHNLEFSSPDGAIVVKVNDADQQIHYSVSFNGQVIIDESLLGLGADSSTVFEIAEVSESSHQESWNAVWGSRKEIENNYHEVVLKLNGSSAQRIIFRAYNDGVAFRYQLPEGKTLDQIPYQNESSEVALVSDQPVAWVPLSSTLVSDAIDINTWKPAPKGQGKVNKNTRYNFKPERIKTPVTVKLSENVYVSLHEAAVSHSADAYLHLDGHTFSYISKNKDARGSLSPWRTIMIADKPGALIESALITNLNEANKLKETAWIKPGKTMWDWRVHGAIADDGFKYGMTTPSYLRFIDFASENNVEYVLVDAEWYGHEKDPKSDPKTYLPQIDIPQICAYAKEKGVGIWLYVNTIGLEKFDIDETLKLYNEWGVVGIKQGFLNGDSRKHIERAQAIARKCAEYKIMYVLHEPHKPTGYRRTYPNILAYEYVNSMLDGPSRPSATPTRVINGLFVHALAGPVDRSCGMYDLDNFISRDKCHRQLPSTVVSQTAQCLLFPSGLLTLPDMPDAYRRKADLFEFISQLPMTWDDTKVLDAEIGQYITMARQSGAEWFVASLTNEEEREAKVNLDFLTEGVTYDLTLYEDAPDAHYAYEGPGNKIEAKAMKQEMRPHKTRRELYQVRKISVKKGDEISFFMAPGGGHCMWIRPQ